MKISIFILLFLIGYKSLAWEKEVSIDKMTDEKYVQLVQPSKKAVWSTKKAFLVIFINCKTENKTLLIQHPWLVEKEPATIRFDKEASYTLYAEPTKDLKLLRVGDPSYDSPDKNPEGIIEKMKSKKTFLINYSQAGGSTIQAEFNISGLDKKMKNICK